MRPEPHRHSHPPAPHEQQYQNLLARERHYESHFGPIVEPVMHSTDHKRPHIDIYQFPPSGDRDYWTLITGGMSDEPQTAPIANHRTEILTYAREPAGWLFNILKGLAEMPFDRSTFLHWWHSVPNGKCMTARPSLLTAHFFLPPFLEPPSIDSLKIQAQPVNILWLFPITETELAFKQTRGGEALEELIVSADLHRAIDEGRRSLV